MSKPPVKLATRSDRWHAWYTALIKEHNLVNTLWLNLHPVVDGELYRSAQPTPWQLEKLVRKYGFASVINLRGAKPHRPVYALERRALEELGVEMLDIEIFSRAVPDEARLKELKALFETARYPALMHCKAGADRSSLAAVLYLHWIKKVPVEEGMQKHMRFLPYGYIAASKAGVIRAWLAAFAEYEAKHPGTDIIDWSKILDRERFQQNFFAERGNLLANLLHDKILRRE